MLVIQIREPGGPEVLVPGQRPCPEPQAGEVLIKVRAAGVNRPDIMQRQGIYPPPPGASDIPGLEIAGTVETIGEGVDAWCAGDRVCALVAGGGYAEYAAAPAPQCLPVPRRLDFTAAAAIPETFFTVWTNVFERGRLQPGESLLVHGLFNGDPYPANFLFQPRAVAFLDFGFVRRLSPAFLEAWRGTLRWTLGAGSPGELRDLAIAMGLVADPQRFDFRYHLDMARLLCEPQRGAETGPHGRHCVVVNATAADGVC